MREEKLEFPTPIKRDYPFWLEGVGTSYCDETYHMSRGYPRVNVIEYIISGKGTLQTTSGTFYPSAGDSYLLRQRSPHSYYSDAKEPWVKIWVNFSGTIIAPIMDAYNINNSMLLPNLDCSIYINQMHRIAQDNKHDIKAMNYQASIVFLQLCQFIHQNLEVENRPLVISENIVALKNYIDLHLNVPLSLETCNDITCLSTSQTIRAFRQAYGMAPYEYLNNQRIASAKLMLRNTSLSIHDIALQLGFQDQNYFSKYFKKKCGQSPKQYREYQ